VNRAERFVAGSTGCDKLANWRFLRNGGFSEFPGEKEVEAWVRFCRGRRCGCAC
jgi:hypothetical protein